MHALFSRYADAVPRIVRFDLSHIDLYEVQAAVLAFIAWPEDEPCSAMQSEAQVALVSHMFRSAVLADPALASKRITVRMVYLLGDQNRLITTVGRTYDRLRRNMIAMRVLRPFVQKALFGKDMTPLPADLAQLSLNAATEWVTQRSPGSPDAHTFEHKVVRRLYPVLHLGTALEMILHKAEQATGRTPKAEFLMMEPDLTRDLVVLAEQLEPVVLRIEQFNVSDESQVRVRLLG